MRKRADFLAANRGIRVARPGFVLLAPIFLTNLISGLAASGWVPVSQNFLSHLPLMIYGAMIIGFLLLEPLGLAKIYDNIRKYFLVWPFRHAQR